MIRPLEKKKLAVAFREAILNIQQIASSWNGIYLVMVIHMQPHRQSQRRSLRSPQGFLAKQRENSVSLCQKLRAELRFLTSHTDASRARRMDIPLAYVSSIQKKVVFQGFNFSD